MAYTINEECIACDKCRPECPVEAISEGDPNYIIDENACADCEGYYDSPRCVAVCPVDACVPVILDGEFTE